MYLGFILDNLLEPPAVLRLLAHQLDVPTGVLDAYSQRQQTGSDHLLQVMQYPVSIAQVLVDDAYWVPKASLSKLYKV